MGGCCCSPELGGEGVSRRRAARGREVMREPAAAPPCSPSGALLRSQCCLAEGEAKPQECCKGGVAAAGQGSGRESTEGCHCAGSREVCAAGFPPLGKEGPRHPGSGACDASSSCCALLPHGLALLPDGPMHTVTPFPLFLTTVGALSPAACLCSAAVSSTETSRNGWKSKSQPPLLTVAGGARSNQPAVEVEGEERWVEGDGLLLVQRDRLPSGMR